MANLVGKTFGRLKVISLVRRGTHGGVYWKCRCTCGKKRIATGYRLAIGHTRSCGCLQLDSAAQVGHANATHGAFLGKANAGELPRPIRLMYGRWTGIRQRCYDKGCPVFKHYGGRGIKMSASWRNSFSAFLKDMGYPPAPKLTIERKDNNGPYSKANCRWATILEQGANKRNNRLLTIGGKTRHLLDWARASGVNYATIWTRIDAMWPPSKWLVAPGTWIRPRSRLRISA